MKDAYGPPRLRAVEALTDLLGHMSTIRVREIGSFAPGLGQEIGILAYIEVLGREHTLACKICGSDESADLRTTLHELRRCITQYARHTEPVIIVPHLSPEAKALCEASGTGCLDFHGNAYLAVDEVFISKRSPQHRFFRRSSIASERIVNAQRHARNEGPGVQEKSPPTSSQLPQNTARAEPRTRPR